MLINKTNEWGKAPKTLPWCEWVYFILFIFWGSNSNLGFLHSLNIINLNLRSKFIISGYNYNCEPTKNRRLDTRPKLNISDKKWNIISRNRMNSMWKTHLLTKTHGNHDLKLRNYTTKVEVPSDQTFFFGVKLRKKWSIKHTKKTH